MKKTLVMLSALLFLAVCAAESLIALKRANEAAGK